MGMTETGGVTFVLIARVPAEGVTAFRAYEDRVLPLLGECGGQLQRRMRNDDGTIEMHVVWFAATAAFERYRSDPRRAAFAPLLKRPGAVMELFARADGGDGIGDDHLRPVE